MDLLDLLARPSVSDGPITLAIRPTERTLNRADVLSRALRLLASRGKSDEILLMNGPDLADVPARIDGVRIRVVAEGAAVDSSFLSQVLSMARRPVIVTIDDRLSLSGEEFAEIVNRLDGADVVVGSRRRRGGWLLWPVERLIKAVFGVPLADPLSPVKAIRRSSVAGLVLETPGPVADFELLAKMTYLVSLVDEVAIEDEWRGAGVLRNLLRQPTHTWRHWIHPEFRRGMRPVEALGDRQSGTLNSLSPPSRTNKTDPIWRRNLMGRRELGDRIGRHGGLRRRGRFPPR